MARRWNLDGLRRHAQGVAERGKGVRRSRAKVPPAKPRECPYCHRQITSYYATHLDICDAKGGFIV